MEALKSKKGVVGQTVRRWLGVRRWRWWPTVLAWVAVSGAVLAAGPYRLWAQSVIRPGSVPGLQAGSKLFAVFPETRWQLLAGTLLFVFGVGGCVRARYGQRGWGRLMAWYGAGAVFWTLGLVVRSIYDSYTSGGPTALFVKTFKTAWHNDDWGEPIIQLVRVMYHDILIPNTYIVRLSDWFGRFMHEHLPVPILLGFLLWALFSLFTFVPVIGDVEDWHLLWSTPLPPVPQTQTQPAPAAVQTAVVHSAEGLAHNSQAGGHVLNPFVADLPKPERTKPAPHAFDELVGVGEAVELLKAQVSAWLRPQEAAAFGIKPARGILFYGPPGTGKTSLARAAARYFGVSFVSVSTPELLSHWIGATEERVHQLFQQARRAAPCIVFLDEIDAVGRRRDDRHLNRPSDLVLPVLLQELDGFRPLEGVLVIAATNRRDVLDEALLRRFTYQIHIGLPDAAGRAELLRRHLKGLATELDFAQAAERLDGLSPADIEAICQRIRQQAWLEKTSGRRYRPVTLADLERELGGRRRWQDDVL